jgi:hypothetical protein
MLGFMNAIQQTAEIGADRMSLRLEKPLPETVSAGRVDITIIIAEKRRPKADTPTPASAATRGDAFGIWKDRGVSLAQIREKAWRR